MDTGMFATVQTFALKISDTHAYPRSNVKVEDGTVRVGSVWVEELQDYVW